VLLLLAGGCAGRTHIAAPASGESVSWFLRAGPHDHSQPIVCASDKASPCVVNLSTADKQAVEATLVIALPPGSEHAFKGQAVLGFIGGTDAAGYTMQIDRGADPKVAVLASTTGVVMRAGRFPMRITLEETGPDLQTPRHHDINVTVVVQ